MSREIKRVPLDYTYVEGETWPGYVISCDGCEFKPGEDEECEQDPCVRRVEPPTGEGWQVWEDVSEGGPVSPVFNDVDLLIEHLHEHGAGGVFQPCTRAAARNFVEVGWAPTMVISNFYGVVDSINAYFAGLHPFLHGFDQLSDDILDEVGKRFLCTRYVDSTINDLLLKFRARTDKFLQFHQTLTDLLCVVNEYKGELPKEIAEAAKACKEIAEKLYPQASK